MVEKVAKDFFREELVDDPGITTSMVVLEGVLVRMEEAEELEAEVVTLVEAAEIMNMIPVGVGVDLSMPETISKRNVAIKLLVTVK